MYTITLDTPPSVQEKLKKVVDLASKDFDSVPYEGDAEDTYGYETPKFINLHGLEYDILAELQVRKLSCPTPHFYFLFFNLFYFICFILFTFVLFSIVLFHFVFCFFLFCFVFLCCVLFCFILTMFVLGNSLLFCITYYQKTITFE